jgi:hypothetical protein
MLHSTGHYEATGPRWDQQIDPSNQRTWAIHARCHPSNLKGIQRVLVSQLNPSDPGKGMIRLLNDGDNILTQVQSTDAITAGSVLKSAKKRVDEFSTTTGKTILPTFTTRTEAHEEADQLNVINQSVIGAKEGVVKAVSKLVSSDITNAIL